MLKNFEEALEMIRNDNSRKVFFSGSKSDDLIDKAEVVIGFKFSPMFRRFIRELGAGSYGSTEFLGLIDDDFEESCVPDGIWYTLNERKSSELPNNLLVIYETGDGQLYCQDYNNIENSEPKIVMYLPGLGNEEQTYEIVANNFDEFFIEKLNVELS